MATEGTGKNAARDLGQGWKVSPSVRSRPGSTFTLAEIKGPGRIQQIWMTPTGNWRHSILRFYWDDETEPSVECPVGDFFACGWGKYCQITSLAGVRQPGQRLQLLLADALPQEGQHHPGEHRTPKDMTLYYQINYTLTDVPEDAGYFHAQFRREARSSQKGLYTILDGVKGQGQYVGTYLAWEVNNNGWWGEGEIKFFMDGDKEFPTICGTGTEDYFCGSYNFENPETQEIPGVHRRPTPGLAQVIPPDKIYEPGQRFGLYRWHIMDPVRFEKDLKVTIQALGWQSGGRYLPLEDDIASVAYWYQKEPHRQFPKLPDGL